MLWDEQFRHVNLSTLKYIFNKNIIENPQRLKGEEGRCESCVLGKSTRATHPKLPQIRSREIIYIIHNDVWGLAEITTKHGYRYVSTFI